MADVVYRYEIDGTLVDPNGNRQPIDGSFQVDYTTGAVSNITITGYNTGYVTSTTAQNGLPEYTVSLFYFPQGPYLINYGSITYNTMLPAYADSASATSGITQNPFTPASPPDTYSAQMVPLVGAVVCFAQGTAILTARGEVAVERLAVGDLAVTSSGAHRPIRWLGHRTLDCTRHPQPETVMPVRIAAHSFGAGRPSRDLVVSPGHAIAVDVGGEVLIPALSLVDGAAIRQEPVTRVTYWHVELDSHELILAENLPCESYLDMGNRDFFARASSRDDAVTTLHGMPDGVEPVGRDSFCRPFQAAGPVVAAARERLAALAAMPGRRDCPPVPARWRKGRAVLPRPGGAHAA